jgi:hypothetical protein
MRGQGGTSSSRGCLYKSSRARWCLSRLEAKPLSHEPPPVEGHRHGTLIHPHSPHRRSPRRSSTHRVQCLHRSAIHTIRIGSEAFGRYPFYYLILSVLIWPISEFDLLLALSSVIDRTIVWWLQRTSWPCGNGLPQLCPISCLVKSCLELLQSKETWAEIWRLSRPAVGRRTLVDATECKGEISWRALVAV